MGAIFSEVVRSYPGEEQRANDLITYPALFMGIGNMISVPLSMVIGRRPVFVASLVILVASGAWCATSKSLSSHIAGRDVMSLAAGQSESLVPLMVQELHFLHNRSRYLSWMLFIQSAAVGVFFIVSQHLVAAYGWRWWYIIFTIVNGTILLLSVPLVAETAFDRLEEPNTSAEPSNRSMTHAQHQAALKTMSDRRWHHGLKLYRTKNPGNLIRLFYWRVLQSFTIWPVCLIFLINGTFLSIYVFQSATFATTLAKPPYHVPFVNLAYVQGAQVLVSFIFLPVLGYGSDAVIKVLSKHNNSFYKPEYRFVVFVVPAIVGIVCAVIYGQACQVDPAYSAKWSWASIAVPFNGSFFAFVGASIMGLTYAADSFPEQAGPLFVLICAGRGIVSFGLSYATLPATQTIGIDGLMNILAGIGGAFCLMLVPAFFLGPRSRIWATQHLFRTQET